MQIHKNFDALEGKVHMNIPKTPFMKKKRKEKEKRKTERKQQTNL